MLPFHWFLISSFTRNSQKGVIISTKESIFYNLKTLIGVAVRSEEVVQTYIESFNTGNREKMFSTVDSNVSHEVNQGEIRVGISQFKEFMKHMDDCYKETLKDIVILTNPHFPERVSVEFTVEGNYLKTDSSLPPARNQFYAIRAGSFFEVKNSKISRITTYYNLPKWINIVKC